MKNVLKRQFVFVFVLLVSTFLSFNSNAFEQPQGIEVSGKAVVVAVPDQFILSFAITDRGKIASKMKIVVDHKTSLVVAAAKKLGIDSKDIQSARMNLRPLYKKSSITVARIGVNRTFANNKHGRVRLNQMNNQTVNKVYAFEVTRRMAITFKTIDNYDQLLDKLVKIGVTNISSLSILVSNADVYYQRALMQAIAVAKEKALKIAGQAGVGLGRLVYLKEISYHAPMRMSMALNKRRSSVYHSQVGSQNISAEVLATFAILP